MKTKNLWVVSMMALVMAACSSDDEMNNAGVVQDNEGAVVTLKLDMSNPQTKGNPAATNEQDGSTEENAISNVTVVVKYADETKVFKNTDSGVTWRGESKTFEFETPAGDATFYVYANVNGADDLSTSWATTLVSNAAVVSAYYTNDSFFMSNQNGEGVEHTINADTENNITVNIERAAAKVTVESKSDFSGEENPFGGKLMDMHFALGNMVSKFYLLQQAPISIPSTVSYLPENDQTGDDWTEVVLNQSASGVSSTELVSFNAAYCMENVQSEYKQNNTTYIKFSTVFTPDKALDFNTTGGGDWTVKGTLKDVNEPSLAADAPSFFVVLDGNAEYTSNYIMKSDLYGDNNQLKSGLSISPAEGGGNTITGITGITKISDEYVSGKCFFGPIWINLNTDGNASPIYRNDWYHLTVNSIKLPGLPSEPGDGGDIPLTPNVDVTLTLSVLDWNMVNHNVDLQ